MSRPLSTHGEIDIPANEQRAELALERYALAYVVLRYTDMGMFEYVDYGVAVETAINQSRAIDAVFNPLTKKYRECNGYIVRVKAERIVD